MTASPTLRDVAKRAGVSLSTASQALNNKSDVSSETRARVLKAAVELGYQQQIRVSSPLVGKLVTVGLLLRATVERPNTTNPFYSVVMMGAERECQRLGISLMVATTEVNAANQPITTPGMFVDQRIDGLLVVGCQLPKGTNAPHQSKPYVLVDTFSESVACDNVVTDNLNGAYLAVSHLIEQGHRHIALVGSRPDDYPSIRERRKGYMRALKHHGITHSYIEDGNLGHQPARQATLKLLQTLPQLTAVFACNDDSAMGVYEAARELGRRVPEDLSVMGFDDVDFSSRITPALTTVHVDKLLMGAMAIRLLRDQVEEPGRTPVTAVIGTRIVVRDSVRATTPADL